ncbi:unnamed protein product, partial [Polarella glacialis]
DAQDLCSDEESDPEPVDGLLFCNRCRRVMHEQKKFSMGSSTSSATPSGRLKAYRRTASQKGVPFRLTDNEAMGVMFRPCRYCGVTPPPQGHGITRLRKVGEEQGGFMGPYSLTNTETACAHCNLAKGHHTEEAFVEICRHVASQKGLGDFGRFPDRFRDNISKKSRSCYLADTKTHALTNAQFREIVEKPCFYCGKEPRKGEHYNGLDRLDNTVRVYTSESCVACCGTCNIMKYRWTLEEFLEHCKRVATYEEEEEEIVELTECAMSAPQRNLATVLRALETEEHVAASHERRGVEFAEQLAAKHHEVLMLKESLQAKGAKLDRQAEASSAEALRRCIAIEEAANDVDRRLQRSEA